jgi:hypothetical protein
VGAALDGVGVQARQGLRWLLVDVTGTCSAAVREWAEAWQVMSVLDATTGGLNSGWIYGVRG